MKQPGHVFARLSVLIQTVLLPEVRTVSREATWESLGFTVSKKALLGAEVTLEFGIQIRGAEWMKLKTVQEAVDFITRLLSERKEGVKG